MENALHLSVCPFQIFSAKTKAWTMRWTNGHCMNILWSGKHCNMYTCKNPVSSTSLRTLNLCVILTLYTVQERLVDFTLSNARRLYSSKGGPLGSNGLSTCCLCWLPSVFAIQGALSTNWWLFLWGSSGSGLVIQYHSNRSAPKKLLKGLKGRPFGR